MVRYTQQMDVLTHSLIWRQTHKEQFLSSVYPHINTTARIWEQTKSFKFSLCYCSLSIAQRSTTKWWIEFLTVAIISRHRKVLFRTNLRHHSFHNRPMTLLAKINFKGSYECLATVPWWTTIYCWQHILLISGFCLFSKRSSNIYDFNITAICKMHKLCKKKFYFHLSFLKFQSSILQDNSFTGFLEIQFPTHYIVKAH